MNFRRQLLIAFGTLMAFGLASPSLRGQVVKPLRKPEIEFLVKQNELGRSAIHTASYSFTIDVQDIDHFGHPFEDRQVGKIEKDGSRLLMFNDHAVEIIPNAGAATRRARREGRVVVSDRYLATWVKGSGDMIQQYDYSAIPDMSADVREMISDTGEDPLAYAFGSGRMGLRDLITSQQAFSDWRAKEPAAGSGGREYHILRYWTGGGKEWLMQDWVLDGSRGFLVSSLTTYASRGVIGERHTLQIDKDVNGVWTPTRIVVEIHHAATHRGSPHDSANSVLRRREINVSHMILNRPISPTTFSIAALQAPDGTGIARRTIQGDMETWYVRDDKEIPANVEDTFEADARSRDASSRLRGQNGQGAITNPKIVVGARSSAGSWFLFGIVAAGLALAVAITIWAIMRGGATRRIR